MIRLLCILSLSLIASGCAMDPPKPPLDPVGTLLEAGERVTLRMPAQLLHGHDMQEPSYDAPEGYRPIPSYQGELALTDRRLLFVETPPTATPSWLSIPYAAVARARPSRTPLLNYVVLWDADGHSDSFLVDSRNVQALHRQLGQALMTRTPGDHPKTSHALVK